jgi:hypothetical protein
VFYSDPPIFSSGFDPRCKIDLYEYLRILHSVLEEDGDFKAASDVRILTNFLWEQIGGAFTTAEDPGDWDEEDEAFFAEIAEIEKLGVRQIRDRKRSAPLRSARRPASSAGRLPCPSPRGVLELERTAR